RTSSPGRASHIGSKSTVVRLLAMRTVLLLGLVACVHPAPRRPMIREGYFDVVLDFDQPREPGEYNRPHYVGPKQYDKLFVRLQYRAPPDTHPLGTVERVELVADHRSLATFARGDLGYRSERRDDVASDAGLVSYELERMQLSLGSVSTYIAGTHPY